MLGAVIGDIVGSRFERDNHKDKNFELFTEDCLPTDDSIMTIAIADAIMKSHSDLSLLKKNAIKSMQHFGRMYPYAGYGGTFRKWLAAKKPMPYNSFGNGAAMRVSACGFAASNLEDARAMAYEVTKVTHNHEEGLKGADAVVTAIYLARIGNTKDEINKHIKKYFYDIDFTLDDIRDTYKFDVSCQGSVPQAFEAFFESNSFEDAIRNAISIGGDSDTIAAITGSIAEAYYGIPENLIGVITKYLDANMMEVVYYFEKNNLSIATDCCLSGSDITRRAVFEVIDEYVDKIIPKGTKGQDIYDENGMYIHTLYAKNDIKPDFESFGDKSKKIFL